MKYRIKLIQKYGSEDVFIPQYFEEHWIAALLLRIIFSPVIFFIWLVGCGEKKWIDISNYFSLWHDIHYDKSTMTEVIGWFHPVDETCRTCDTQMKAEQVIQIHKREMQTKIENMQEKKAEIKRQKAVKISYININS